MAGKSPSYLLPSFGSIVSSDDIEAGFSGGALFLNPYYYKRCSYQSLAPRKTEGVFLDDFSDEECHHFLDSCFLCKKQLTSNRDIYMYRGDTPFCSEGCRQEQIEMDDARERNWKLSMRKEQQKHIKSSSPTKSQRIGIRVGTVVPA